jgi:hypothetical protein
VAEQETPETVASIPNGDRQQLDEITAEERLRTKHRASPNAAFVLQNDDLTRLDTGREQRTTLMTHWRLAVKRQNGVEVISRRSTRGIDKVRHVSSFAQTPMDVGRSSTNFDGRLPTCTFELDDANLVRMSDSRLRGSP